MKRIIAVVNQKGGVGKTTTTLNVAASIAALGHNTLVVDFDPQGNATTGLGATRASRHRGTYALVTQPEFRPSSIYATGLPRLSLITADAELAAAELELAAASEREFRLRQALSRLEIVDTTVFIDCPPSLGLLTLNALVAADAVLIPLQCEFFALEGISQLVRTIDRVKRALNPKLVIQGILLTMFDTRNNLSELVASDARAFFSTQVYQTVIPRSVRVSEAPSHGKPVVTYDPKSSGARAYVRLAHEFLAREAVHAGP